MKILLSILSLFTLSSVMAEPTHFITQKWITQTGARVVFYQANEVPMLTVNLAFNAGSAHEGAQFGLSALTTDMINEGSLNLDATAIAERLASTGAQYNAESSRDMAVLSLKTLTEPKALNKAIATFALMVAHPSFEKNVFQRIKNQQLMAIKQTNESPESVANQLFYETLYPKHPYGHPLLGTSDTVKNITLNEVKQFYQHYFVGSNAIIVLVGDIHTQQAHQLAEKITASLPKGTPAAPTTPAPMLKASVHINHLFPSSQTMMILGQVGITHDNPNYFPLMVGNYTLGGGMLVSRLATEVREKRGLTYGVYSQFTPMPGNGPFIITLSTKNSQAKEALTITEQTLHQFLSSGPSESELKAAKDYLTGSFPLSLASNTNIANMLLRMTFYQLPDNYLDTYIDNINQVTQSQIKAAFDEIISPSKMIQITVGQA